MKRKSWIHRHLPILALGLMVTLIGSGAFALLRSFLRGGSPHPQQVVQQIQLIRPPPPPPNLPPPPPPPPEEKVHIATPQKAPQPTPDHPPPSQQLGLDAKGGAGSDAFGLAAKPGGQDIIGEGGSAFSWYAGLLKDQILNQLGAQAEARSASYTVVVSVWVGQDGTVQRVEIAKSSGDSERDRSIESALARLGRLTQPPPADMPEPITLRIVSHS
ncbi:MAG TPA: TonB family protein [Steroidobacteraceae bacterium]|jgi:protein TonB